MRVIDLRILRIPRMMLQVYIWTGWCVANDLRILANPKVTPEVNAAIELTGNGIKGTVSYIGWHPKIRVSQQSGMPIDLGSGVLPPELGKGLTATDTLDCMADGWMCSRGKIAQWVKF